MALLLSEKRSDIEIAAAKISEGNIVIFPTETVYGIGANAMNPKAINKIFSIKNRPQNNPLILHISNFEMAYPLISADKKDIDLFKTLAKSFWPGPVTFLLKKSKYVNDICTAGSSFVGLRCPSNKTARDLIYLTGVPICAPSANISGKASSTSISHVLDYFKNNSKVTIVKSDKPCQYGIESTIVKIDNQNLTILRPGIILKSDIDKVLESTGKKVNIEIPLTQSVNPGSSIDHYQINKKMILANFMADESLNQNLEKFNIMKSINYYLMNSVFIDFGGNNINMMDKFYGYVDLSEKGNPREALFNLYNVLHQLKEIECSNVIVFNYFKNKNGYYRTLYDRLIRCCAGKETIIPYTISEGTLCNTEN